MIMTGLRDFLFDLQFFDSDKKRNWHSRILTVISVRKNRLSKKYNDELFEWECPDKYAIESISRSQHMHSFAE